MGLRDLLTQFFAPIVDLARKQLVGLTYLCQSYLILIPAGLAIIGLWIFFQILTGLPEGSPSSPSGTARELASPGPVVSATGSLPQTIAAGLDPDHPDHLLRALVCWSEPDFVADPRRSASRRLPTELPGRLYPRVLVVGEVFTEPTIDPILKRPRKWFLLVEAEPGTNPARVRKSGHLGWLPEEQLVPFASKERFARALRPDGTPIHRKCLLIRSPEGAALTDRPDARGRPIPPRTLPGLFYVYKETATHVFVGDQPTARYADALIGWVPRQHVCTWDTRDAVEFNRHDHRTRPAVLFRTRQDAVAYLKSTKPTTTADLGPGGKFEPRPLAVEDLAAPAGKHFRFRFPILSEATEPIGGHRIYQVVVADLKRDGWIVTHSEPGPQVGWLIEHDPREPVPANHREGPPTVRHVVLMTEVEAGLLHRTLSVLLDRWDEAALERTWARALDIVTAGEVKSVLGSDRPANLLRRHLGLPIRSIGLLQRTFDELRTKASELPRLKLELKRALNRIADVIEEKEATYAIEKDMESGQEIMRRFDERPRSYWWGADPARPEVKARVWIDRSILP